MMAFGAWPHYISEYGYIAIFLVALVEGPIVTVFAAFLASQGVFSLPAVFGTVVLGDLVGDGTYYAVGRWGLGRLPLSWRHRWPTLRRHVEHIGQRLRSQPGRALLFGKLTHSAGFGILLAAGAARLRVGEFFFYNLLGTLPKSAALMAVGYFFGQFYRTLSGWFQLTSLIVFVLLTGVILYILHRWCTSYEEAPSRK